MEKELTFGRSQALQSAPRLTDLHRRQQKPKASELFATDIKRVGLLSQSQSELAKEIRKVKQALRQEADTRFRDEYF